MGEVLMLGSGGGRRAGHAGKVKEAALAREADGSEDVGVGEGPEGDGGGVEDRRVVEAGRLAEGFADEEFADQEAGEFVPTKI